MSYLNIFFFVGFDVHAMSTILAISHQANLIFLMISFLFCNMLPWVVSTIDEDGVRTRRMLHHILILMSAKQVITIVMPVCDVQKTTWSHSVQFGGGLEPAELRAILICPLSRYICFNQPGVEETLSSIFIVVIPR